MNIFLILTLHLFFSALICTSCSDDDDGKHGRGRDTSSSRTVLVYMVAENSLYSYVSRDVNEMLAGVKDMSDNDRLVVYVDDNKLPRIYTLTNKNTEVSFSSLKAEYVYEKDVNSASGEVLNDVMTYVVKHHPADGYGVIFWSHGSGWIPEQDVKGRTPAAGTPVAIPGSSSLNYAFGIDNGANKGSNDGRKMSIDAIALVMEKFANIKFLFFDACFMQTIEAAYELRRSANYVIGSPAEIPGDGAPYGMIMKPMFADSLDVTGMIEQYQKSYNGSGMGVLLTALDCSRLSDFSETTAVYLEKYKDRLLALDYSTVQNYFLYDSWRRYTVMPDCYDMRGVMRELMSDEDFAKWDGEFRKLVVASCYAPTWYSMYKGYNMPVDEAQYGGVSMFVPLEKYKSESFYGAYSEFLWAKAVGLDN